MPAPPPRPPNGVICSLLGVGVAKVVSRIFRDQGAGYRLGGAGITVANQHVLVMTLSLVALPVMHYGSNGSIGSSCNDSTIGRKDKSVADIFWII